jgi:hypothetical protein
MANAVSQLETFENDFAEADAHNSRLGVVEGSLSLPKTNIGKVLRRAQSDSNTVGTAKNA